MLARVYTGHLDVGGEEGEVFEGNSLVGVVADDILHHEMRGEWLTFGIA